MQKVRDFLKDWKKVLWLLSLFMWLAAPIAFFLSHFSHVSRHVHYGAIFTTSIPFLLTLIYGIVAYRPKLITSRPKLVTVLSSPTQPLAYATIGLLFMTPALVLVAVGMLMWGTYLTPSSFGVERMCTILPASFCEMNRWKIDEYVRTIESLFTLGLTLFSLAPLVYLAKKFKKKFYIAFTIVVIGLLALGVARLISNFWGDEQPKYPYVCGDKTYSIPAAPTHYDCAMGVICGTPPPSPDVQATKRMCIWDKKFLRTLF